MCLKQLRIEVPAGTIQPTHQLLVRDAHSAAVSVLPSSACAAIYGVMPHVHISNTPSSTNVIVELDRLLQFIHIHVKPMSRHTVAFKQQAASHCSCQFHENESQLSQRDGAMLRVVE